jgi:uncharacterized protein DUF4238
MSKDHFVAQTYLKHWCDPRTGKLRGYKKAADENFPCAPKDVCHEWDWDINPLFKGNPGLLADFRKIFEPQWNPAVLAARTGTLSSEDKFHLAGYWAQLTTCTPAWHAHAVEVGNRLLAGFIPSLAKHVAQQFSDDREYIEKAVAEGRLKPNLDGDHVKGLLTQQLTKTTIVLYHHDWIILKNNTEVPFITSDNPSSVCPRRAFTVPLTRFLPLAPDLGILTVAKAMRREGLALPDPDLLKPPPGTVRRRSVGRKRAAMLNRITVMNADQLVFTTTEKRQVRRLIRNHRRFGLAVESIPMGAGPVTGAMLVVRQIRGR